MCGAGLRLRRDRAQVGCCWTNTHTAMDCWRFVGKGLLLSWARALRFRFLERNCRDTRATWMKDLPSGAANRFNNWNTGRSCWKELVFSFSCSFLHSQPLEGEGILQPLVSEDLGPFSAAQLPSPPPVLVNERSQEEDEAAKRKTQKRDLQRQKGEKAGNARGPAADHHRRPSHAGCCSTADCCLCLCSDSSKYNRVMRLFRLSSFGVLIILSRAKRNSLPLF